MKAMQVRLEDSEDKVYRWTIRHTKATNLTLGCKPRQVQGWTIEDHEGYERFTEGNWHDLVPRFHAVAENYGLRPLTQVS